VESWLKEPGASPQGVAVLARVQSLLLAPHVALAEAGVPVDSILDEGVLSRLGVRAALAYLRIAVDPQHVSGADLAEVHRRPSRGLPQWAVKWLDRCRSVADVRQAATRIDDVKVAQKLDDLALDLDRLASIAAHGASARDLLTAVRDDVGLGSAMTLLDSTGAAAGSHLDDLEALLQVADLHHDASSFEAWLRRSFHREHAPGGVTLSTIHRVKGREWDRVVVFGVTDGIVPHRLADDHEEERRILHVGITRGRQRVLVLGDRSRRSPFLGELDGSAPRVPARAEAERRPVVAARKPAPVLTTLPAAVGLHVRVLGGYEGTISAVEDGGVRLALDDGGSFLVRFGERITHDGIAVTLGRPPTSSASDARAALRAWRLERSRADDVPAFVVLSDKHLDGIAAVHPSTLAELRSCPGIGPAKLESYGDEILAVLESISD
jgi:DNA helicase-2/ATP-dependent DNA helicase PcrA